MRNCVGCLNETKLNAFNDALNIRRRTIKSALWSKVFAVKSSTVIAIVGTRVSMLSTASLLPVTSVGFSVGFSTEFFDGFFVDIGQRWLWRGRARRCFNRIGIILWLRGGVRVVTIIPRPCWTPAIFFLFCVAALRIAVAGHGLFVLVAAFHVIVPIRALAYFFVAVCAASTSLWSAFLKSSGKGRTFTTNVSEREEHLSKAETIQILALDLHASNEAWKLWVILWDRRELVH